MSPSFSFPITGFQAVLVQSYYPFSVEKYAYLVNNECKNGKPRLRAGGLPKSICVNSLSSFTAVD